MTKWKIYNEDAVEWAKNYQKGKFHALLTDAPYHLTSITKRFGKKGSAPAKRGTDGVFQRSSKGFMGTQWDGGDVAFRSETWEAFQEVLYPGAFGMAFSASRNWHRMAVAIEDAGFIIHPTMFFLWIQGQGFPKATRIDKTKNRDAGEDRKSLNIDFGMKNRCAKCGKPFFSGSPCTCPKPKSDHPFAGHRYGLQALKPSVEPIIVFQKPYEGKPIDNIVSTGAGALNIDAARIPLATDDEYTINTFDDGAKPWGNGAGHKYTSRKVEKLSNHSRSTESAKSKGIYGDSKAQETHQTPGQLLGRWPSNLIVSDELQGMDEQKRFFHQVSTQLDEADPFLYQGKVGPKERNAGLDESFTEEPAYKYGSIKKSEGRTGINTPNKNPHPTLKPINLAKYLATLLLPPVEYAPRRIFIPFSGSGSEMIGAGLAGWEHVVGVEFDTENNYVDIAEKRLEHWLK